MKNQTILSDIYGNLVYVSHFGISTGDKSAFYTLRAYGVRVRHVRDDDGNTTAESDDTSVYIRNLSTDKEQALESARDYLTKHYPSTPFSGVVNFDLDEIHRISREQAEARRAAEAARVASTDFSVFQAGKHAGKSVAAVHAEDPGYLDWFCNQYFKEGTDYARTQVFANAILAPEREAAAKAKENRIAALRREIGEPSFDAWYKGEAGPFLQSIARDLAQGSWLRGRGLYIVLEILAKWEGRKNSKAYNARLEELLNIFYRE
jgi:hypothetical protein